MDRLYYLSRWAYLRRFPLLLLPPLFVLPGSVRWADRSYPIRPKSALGCRSVIGDGIKVGAGVELIGDIHVGAGARIGANAVVVHDVPAGATAVGIPARVVSATEDVEADD